MKIPFQQTETVTIDGIRYKVTFYYHPAEPQTRSEPGEPEQWNIISVIPEEIPEDHDFDDDLFHAKLISALENSKEVIYNDFLEDLAEDRRLDRLMDY